MTQYTWLGPVAPKDGAPVADPILTPEQVAEQIIDAIPGALGMLPDPWPDEGPCQASDGLPHRVIAKIIADRDEALRARAAELEGAIARLYVVACPGWASDGTATNMLANIERRAAEDAATIARLREHLALSEQHKLVAIESRRDREAELARLTQERDELDVQLTSTADELRRVYGELTEAEAALATLREATTWQPMSTAPKDGRAFLAATRFLGQPCVERIYWDRGWKGAQGEQRFDVWMPLPPCPTLGLMRFLP